MRDKRFVAIHRGGILTTAHHRLLAAWAADCAEQVLPLFSQQWPEDQRPKNAILTARAWARGEVSVGVAQAARVAAHAAARAAGNGAAQDAARAAGHAPGAAMYAWKAVMATVDKVDQKAAVTQMVLWQTERLPEEVREQVLATFATKFAPLSRFKPIFGG